MAIYRVIGITADTERTITTMGGLRAIFPATPEMSMSLHIIDTAGAIYQVHYGDPTIDKATVKRITAIGVEKHTYASHGEATAAFFDMLKGVLA